MTRLQAVRKSNILPFIVITLLWLLCIVGISYIARGQEKMKEPLPAKATATEAQSLEFGNLLLSIENRRNELRALEAEAELNRRDTKLLKDKVPEFITAIKKSMFGKDADKYEATFEATKEGNRLVFTLKKEDAKP